MTLYSTTDIAEILTAQRKPSIRTLHEIWDQRVAVNHRPDAGNVELARSSQWLQNDISLAVAFVRCALKAEEYLLVCDAANETTSYWQNRQDGDPASLTELFVAFADAKTRLGQRGEAFRRLEPWSRDTRLDNSQKARVLRQLGDILADDAHTAMNPTAHVQTGERAFFKYEEAAKLDPTYIDARVKSILTLLTVSENHTARRDNARKMATDALREIRQNESTKGITFRSTLHTAILLGVLGKFDAASKAYATLSSNVDADVVDLADARYESQFIAMALGKPREYFKTAFPRLELIVFAGHMPDLPGAPSRFPPGIVPSVRQALRRKLQELDARVALVSAAAGADLLFVEALLARPGAKLHIVLPWTEEEFLRTSVEPFDPEGRPPVWRPLFQRALQEASTLRQLSLLYEPGDEVGWRYPMEVAAGIALQIARVRHLDLTPMALWDCKPGFGAGGTASFVELWSEYLAESPIVIRLPKTKDRREPVTRVSKTQRCQRPTLHREVKSMLFADVVGYSKLSEKVIPEFVDAFLNKLSRLIAESPYSPKCLNMWGDEIYGVFDYAHEAGLFGLQLASFVREEENEWLRKGLYYEQTDEEDREIHKFPLSIRVGLHTGPVLRIYNPVVRQLTYTGSHVSRAARIQPIVAPGEVYASEEFASLVELDSATARVQPDNSGSPFGRFICEYAGTMPLAKNYPGRFRIYRVTTRRSLPLEELAAAAHSLYCADQSLKGTLPLDSAALLPWEQLSEDLREANRSQVADIPFKLGLIGYELSSGQGSHPRSLKFTSDQVESLSKQEHDRWWMERERQGWTYAPVRDNLRKHHPCLVAWQSLSESEKEKDREVIRNLPRLIEKADLRITRQR